jgi:Cd2+/Zn2+-exporting ATPase
LLLFIIGFLPFIKPFSFYIFLISYILIGSDIVIEAFKKIFRKNFFDENFLMTIATFGAFAIGEYSEGVGVLLFYKIAL